MQTYGKRVAQLRDDLHLTQEQFAEASGVPLRTLQDIEHEKVTRPQRKTRERIDAALGALQPGEQGALDPLPEDVRLFLDLETVYLMALPEESRTAFMHDVIRRMASWAQ